MFFTKKTIYDKSFVITFLYPIHLSLGQSLPMFEGKAQHTSCNQIYCSLRICTLGTLQPSTGSDTLYKTKCDV